MGYGRSQMPRWQRRCEAANLPERADVTDHDEPARPLADCGVSQHGLARCAARQHGARGSLPVSISSPANVQRFGSLKHNDCREIAISQVIPGYPTSCGCEPTDHYSRTAKSAGVQVRVRKSSAKADQPSSFLCLSERQRGNPVIYSKFSCPSFVAETRAEGLGHTGTDVNQ